MLDNFINSRYIKFNISENIRLNLNLNVNISTISKKKNCFDNFRKKNYGSHLKTINLYHITFLKLDKYQCI